MAQSSNFGGTKRGGNRLPAAERQIQALVLRRSGATYQDIARQLGYAGHQGAHKAVATALNRTLRENADALRSLELERLDRMQLGVWGKATSGDTRAIRAVLQIMVRRARLLGLDVPTQISGELLLRSVVERAAKDAGLDFEQVMAEAEVILAEAQRGE